MMRCIPLLLPSFPEKSERGRVLWRYLLFCLVVFCFCFTWGQAWGGGLNDAK